MRASSIEKKFLQIFVVTACLVPLNAGFFGMLKGASLLGGGNVDLDSHVRYLSGLLFGIGLSFLSAVPKIEYHAARFRLLTLIVVLGGIGRALGFVFTGVPSGPMQFGLAMELVVTPVLCLWQQSLARRIGGLS